MSVIVAGSLNIDLVVNLDRMPTPGETVPGKIFQTFPGGKGLNQATSAARSGAKTAMIGALGVDPYSQTLRQVMVDESIDGSHVKTVEDSCGTAIIEVDASGQNRIVVVPGANDSLSASDIPSTYFSSLSGKNVLLAQLENPVSELAAIFHAAKKSGVTTILNPAPVRELSDEFLADVDILVPNQHEAKLLSGIEVTSQESAEEAGRKLLQRGVGAVVLTLGELGALYVSHEKAVFQAAFPVVPIDTTAAGDGFCGGLAAELDRGSSIEEALKFACAVGGLATTKEGAVPSMPTESEVRSFLSKF